jgi:hypothetical protein
MITDTPVENHVPDLEAANGGDNEILNDLEKIAVDDPVVIEDNPTNTTLAAPSRLSDEEVKENARLTSQAVMGVLEMGITMWQPCVEYDDATRELAVNKLAPVLAKYGGVMPPFLVAWKEEIMLLKFFGGFAASTYWQIKAAKEDEGVTDGA